MPVESETGMEWTSLRVLALAPGETYAHLCGESEWIVLPLSGACEVRCADAGPDLTPAARSNDRVPDRDSGTSEGRDDRAARQPVSTAGPDDPACAVRPVAAGGEGEPHDASVEAGGGTRVFELRGRAGVFDGVSDFVYLPRGARADVTSDAGGRFALVGARCEQVLPARYGPADQVPVELRGAGPCSRQVNNFASADAFPCDRLMAVEVLTPGGNWSSYPPHKHDEHHPGEESRLEEIYYFEIAAHGDTPGLGYQRVTPSPAGKTDILTEVRTGDTVLVPDGWHGPSIAAPGHDMYYLNVMAGPDRTREWLIRDHPDHGWIRDTWAGQDIDPRLPFPQVPAAEEERR